MAKEVVAGKSAAVESTVLCCGFSHVQPEHRDHQTRSHRTLHYTRQFVRVRVLPDLVLAF